MENNDDEYISTPQARGLLNVTTQTIRKWADEGKIKYVKTPKGTRRYSKKDIYGILGRTIATKEKRKIIYCRVSSKKQVEDLERQKKSLQSVYPNHELVTDIGSGINWRRSGFRALLEQSMCGNIQEIVVAHRDRLCRFAFELIEWFFTRNKTELIVLDKEEGKSSEQELADDLLSIVHVYACRNMGRRRYKTKKAKESEEKTEQPTETDDGGEEECKETDTNSGGKDSDVSDSESKGDTN
jgi:putative resolvase